MHSQAGKAAQGKVTGVCLGVAVKGRDILTSDSGKRNRHGTFYVWFDITL